MAIIANALYVVNDRLSVAARPSGAVEEEVFRLQVLSYQRPDDIANMQRRDVELLRAIPGVKAATWTNQAPMGQSGWGLPLSVDPSLGGAGVNGSPYFNPDSLVQTLGLELVEGRDFTEADVVEIDPATAQLSGDKVILSRRYAEQLFPDESGVVGRTVHLGAGPDAVPMQVVGVVDTLMSPFAQASDNTYNTFLLPVRYLTEHSQYLVRTEAGQRDRIMAEAEAALAQARPGRLVMQNQTLGELREIRYRNQRAVAGLLIAVTIGLLLVTASGIVGMASLWVTQRRKQIGTRRALGARKIDIVRYFVTENLMISTTGVVIGAALAIGLNLFLVREIALPTLPVGYLLGGTATLLVLGVLAVLGPAWRAAAVPPAVATRSV
ncbi:FtsX-like permease family protein [Alkalisalibacterium limincola]|uniref:FtsX-like permease family protein n=2 Tax=Alkalisalibacterium limincola TaxID=2699169 RepID=A0A5C8KNW6_9GAMM|nr:FtsX-like permease family protein [Alkalisalibacterium limincola]